jgi:Ran GTPase-activating protein (RanGAP) involved in mRNA processing and transport
VGVSALADALKTNTSVKNINLSLNGIGAVGASALADALKMNTTVTRIDLSWNGIGAEGALALADALKGTRRSRTSILHTMESASRVHWRWPTR